MDILIPCKSFARGKSRLAPALPPDRRMRLCRAFLSHTLDQALATGARVAVVTEDEGVARLSRRRGAMVIEDPGQGLNAALSHGNARLGGDYGLMILPADLPGMTAARLSRLTAVTGIGLVPDRRGEGTNLMSLCASGRVDFPFAFGPDSFALHQRAAALRGLALTILRDPVLGFDIDTPGDLAQWPDPVPHTTKGRHHEAA